MQKVVDNEKTIAYNRLNNKQSTSDRRKISWQLHFTHLKQLNKLSITGLKQVEKSALWKKEFWAVD